MSAFGNSDEMYRRELAQHQEQLAMDEKSRSGATVVTEEVKESVDIEKNSTTTGSIHWAPGILARFPWLGFAALFTMLLCIVLTIVVLRTSNNKATEQWPAYQHTTFWEDHDKWTSKAQLKPSVALAVINTVANIALAIMIAQGVSIAWWRSAIKGATVKDLHKSWGFSTSIIELLTAGRKFNLIALAALAAKMALLDNLLLQQAADSVPSSFTRENMNIQLPSVRELPRGYAGVYTNASTGSSSRAFSLDLKNNLNSPDFIEFGNGGVDNDPLGLDSRCRGYCKSTVAGFGFNITCGPETAGDSADSSFGNFSITPETVKLNEEFISLDRLNDPSANQSNYLPPVLLVTSEILEANSPDPNSGIQFPVDTISIITVYARILPKSSEDLTDCAGTMFTRTCHLQPAVVEYPIQFTNFSSNQQARTGLQITDYTNDAALEDPIDGLKDGQIQTIKVLDQAYKTDNIQYRSNMLAIVNVAQSLFASMVALSYAPDIGYTIAADDRSLSPMSNWWVQTTSHADSTLWEPSSKCEMRVFDPMHFIISQLNTLMLRASIHASKNLDPDSADTIIPSSIQGNITADQSLDTVKYESHYSFMWGAISLMIACILCVLPSYWGFWELGRKVTLGPIEISSAFQAPVLAHPSVASGGEVDVLLKEVGHRRVRYGEIEGEGRLGVAEPDAVKKLAKAKTG